MEGQVWSRGSWSFLLWSAFHCLTALLLAAPHIFGSRGICYLFCFGFIEFTVLCCGDDDSTLLFQDRGVGVRLWWWRAAGILSEPLSFIHTMTLRAMGLFIDPMEQLCCQLSGRPDSYFQKRLRRGWVSEFQGRKWNDINMIVFQRCWNFRHDVEISGTEFQKKDVFVVQLERKKRSWQNCSLLYEQASSTADTWNVGQKPWMGRKGLRSGRPRPSILVDTLLVRMVPKSQAYSGGPLQAYVCPVANQSGSMFPFCFFSGL